jgi:tRNA A37 threonylcarbamoyltransferase TsaD
LQKEVEEGYRILYSMKNSNDFNFSYSGIKTAALYKAKELREQVFLIENGFMIFAEVLLMLLLILLLLN